MFLPGVTLRRSLLAPVLLVLGTACGGDSAAPTPTTNFCIRGDIAVGGTVNGTLVATDCDLVSLDSASGGYFESYRLSVASDTIVGLALSSGEFDTFVALLRLVGTDSFVVVALDDDGGGGPSGTNSLINAVPLSAGEDYLVIANGYTYADVGTYTLTVTGRTIVDLLCIRGDVAVGGTVSGTLADTDCDLGNSWFESYRLDPAADVTVDVAMASDVFDTFLFLLRFATPDSLVLVASDDDGGGGPNGTNSLIAGAVLSAASDYLVVANGFDTGDVGDYTVGVTAIAGGAVLGPVRPGVGRWDTLVKPKTAEAGRPPAAGSFPR